MEFTKYHKSPFYHWKMYDDPNTKYRRHADRVKDWIKEINILDIGSGDGKITSLLNAKGVDNEPEGVRQAQEKGVDVVLGDAYKLPFGGEQFESVFMGDVLEHMEKPFKVIQEARRVLSKYLYIAMPIPGMQNDPFHVSEMTPQELKCVVQAAGFKLEGEILVVKEDKRMYAKFLKVDLKDNE